MTSQTNARAEPRSQGDRHTSSPFRAVADRVTPRRWPLSIVALYAATMILPAMDRFFTWDEAVFWSQSGGLDGASADPMTLVASRELGSSVLLGLLRIVEDGIAEVRFLWATLAFLLLVLGARRLMGHIGDRGALIFLWAYGSHWLVLAWTPAFYSNVLAASFALLAATFYLDLISDPDAAFGYWSASLFGLSIAATLAMRPLEGLLVVIALVVHLLVFNLSKIPRLLSKAVLSIGVTFVAVGIPWIADSINRFGSVTERIRAGLSQGGQVASGLRINVVEYASALSGDRVAALPGEPVPYWPRFIVLGVALAAAVVIVVALVRKGISAIRGPAGLFALLSVTSASFFLFWREAVNERYFFITMIFAAALFGWALSTILSPTPRSTSRWILVAVAVVWLATQVVTVTAYENTRESAGDRSSRVAATMRTLSSGMPCEVMSRYGTPQLHVASGCRAHLYTDWSDAVAFAGDNQEMRPQFIYGPVSDGHFEGLPSSWRVLPVGTYRLAYWLPPERSG